jgi:hypothetical protein
MGAAQVIAGLVLALGGRRPAASAVTVANIAAVGGWALTRTVGVSWVQGLEYPERPQVADTVCAALGAIALVLSVVVLLRGAPQAPRIGLVAPGALVGVVSVAAMLTGTTHVHSHDEAGHVHDETAAAATPDADAGHGHGVDPSTWPRPFDPTQPIDFAGVPGVSPEQQARAETLVASTLRDLPQFADVTKIGDLGFTSIGDAAGGFEHYINFAYLRDDAFLDPNKPESLVYQVDGDKRTLVAAMFAASGTSLTDPKLVGWGGPLMQWHVHGDLCWSLDANRQPIVVGSKDATGTCPTGSINAGGDIPMVHVWIKPNQCGPFAALKGRSAGQVAGDSPRVTSAPPTCTWADGRFRRLFGETTSNRSRQREKQPLIQRGAVYPPVIVAPSVSCHTSYLATARLMYGDLRMAPMNARFGAARYHGSLRMTSTKSTTRISSLSFQTSCSNVSSKIRLRPSRQCSVRLPTRIRAAVSSAGVRSAR